MTDKTLGFLVVAPLAVLAVLWAVEFPVLAATTFAAVLVTTALLRVGVATLARRLAGPVREVDVPGVGNVRFRVKPR